MIGFFEDLQVGDNEVLGSYVFTRERIIRFAQKFDPQPFHLSNEAAAKTHFGRLCASGWHTASIFMRLLVLKKQAQEKKARESGIPVALTGPSPGFENLKWLKPVYADDEIRYHREIKSKRESRSRPDWGIIQSSNHGVNQNGEPVFFFQGVIFVQRRLQEPPRL